MLVGRQAELAAIDAGLDDVRAGHGRVVLLLAGPGLGKSALLEAAGARARDHGLQALTARGSELGRELPFDLVRQLFGSPVSQLPEAEQVRVLAGAATPVRGLLGLTPERAAEVDRDGMVLALDRLAANLADRAPMLLVLDDLHWADRQTGRWLSRFANMVAELPILVLSGARRAEPGADAVVEALAADERTRVVAPRPLDVDGVGEVVHAQLGRAGETEFLAACHGSTGGNPFFLRELLRAVAADAIEPVAGEAGRVLRLGPAEVARSILVRLGRLGEPAGRLAMAVAVLGADAELRHAAELGDLPIEEALAAWDALARAEVLQAAQPLEFIHPIARTAAYGELGPGARSRGHRRAAAILARDAAAPERIAVHAFACEPSGDPAVVDWLRAAADSARAAGAPDAAARVLRRALDEPPPPSLRAPINLELGRVLVAIDSGAAVAALADAAAGDSREERLLAHRWRGFALAYSGRLAAADAAFAEAVSLAAGAEERMLLESTRAFYALWSGENHGWVERHTADGLAGATPGERRALAVEALGIAISGARPAGEASALALRARRRLSSWLDLDGGAETANAVGHAAILSDDGDELARNEVAAVAATRRGWTLNAAAARFERATIRLRLGDLVAAEADARLSWATLETARDTAPTLHWWSAATLAAVLLARGALPETGRFIEAARLGAEPFEVTIYPQPALVRGELALAQGRMAEGIDTLIAAGERLEADGFTNPSIAPWRALVAPALAARGRGDEARRIIEPAVRRARAFGAPWALGMALRAQGTVEQGPSGLDLLHEAIATLEPAGCRLELARAQLELGGMLRRDNRRVEAREHLRVALDLAHRSGAQEVARTAQQELAATGARPRRQVLTGVESLTASERRTAELAATGMTNPEIAQALFVTRKTVEAHLGHVYQKLDIDSREHLARALAPEPGPARRRT